MMLTIYTLFNDPNIVSAVIQRVLQTRKDTIYWQQYLDFRRTTTRVFKDYIGQVTGVMAGSINSRYGENQSVSVGTSGPDMVRLPIWVTVTRFPLTACQNCRTWLTSSMPQRQLTRLQLCRIS